MKIGIIGAGHIGATLTRRLSALGHDVSVANSRGPDSLTGLARETGANAVTVRDAARDKDVVIVSIPEKSVRDLPRDLFAGNDRTVVIDTGNYYPQRDGRIEAIEAGMTESQWVAQQLGRPVVKAFNSIYAQLSSSAGALPTRRGVSPSRRRRRPGREGCRVRLVDELGFDGVDAGTLAESWRQQPGTPVYGADLNLDSIQGE